MPDAVPTKPEDTAQVKTIQITAAHRSTVLSDIIKQLEENKNWTQFRT